MNSSMNFDHESFYRVRNFGSIDGPIDFSTELVESGCFGVTWYLICENRWDGEKFCDAKVYFSLCCAADQIANGFLYSFRAELNSFLYTCEQQKFFPIRDELTQKHLLFKSAEKPTCNLQEVLENVDQLEMKLRVTIRSQKPFKTIQTLVDDISSPELADFTILVEGEEFKSHKFILSARSPIFRRMFSSDFEESNDLCMKIEDVPKSIFKIFLNFLYTAQIKKLAVSDLVEVLKVADKYGVESLKSLCDDLLLTTIKVSDPVHDIYQFTQIYNCSQALKDKTYNLIKQKYFKTKALPDSLIDMPDKVEQLVRAMEVFDRKLKQIIN